MRSVFALALVWLSLSAALNAANAQEPLVRVSVTPETISVGETAQLTVTVLVPTWFPRPPTFPSLELANAIVRLPPDSSRPTSERVGRDTWSGIVRSYQVIPLVGATYQLNDLSMTVTYADPDTREPITVNVPVPDIEIRARVPDGAEALKPYIAGRSLTLTRDIDGDVESLGAGDALVLRYTAELDGLPAIFLPPLVGQLDMPGVSAYADEPVIEDDAVARRSEKITFVFETGGNFAIPGIGLNWWNTETNTVEATSVPAISIVVAGPVLAAVDEESLPIRWQVIAFSSLAMLLVVFAISRGVPAAFRRYRRFRDEQRLTERYAFNQLRKTLRSGDAHAAYHALLLWLDRLESGLDARHFAARDGDHELQAEIEQLSRALYFKGDETVDLRKLDIALVSARRNHHRTLEQDKHFALPLMNP